jgi:hypothetical protein
VSWGLGGVAAQALGLFARRETNADVRLATPMKTLRTPNPIGNLVEGNGVVVTSMP